MAPASASSHDESNSNYDAEFVKFIRNFFKKDLEKLTQQTDEKLGRIYVPKIISWLAEVDQERKTFEEAREVVLQQLRTKLRGADADEETINGAVASLQSTYSTHLKAISHLAALGVNPATPMMSSSSSQLSSIRDSISMDLDRDHSVTTFYTTPVRGDYHGENGESSQAGPSTVDHEIREQLMMTNATNGQKRSRDEAFGVNAQGDTPSKVSQDHKPTTR